MFIGSTASLSARVMWWSCFTGAVFGAATRCCVRARAVPDRSATSLCPVTLLVLSCLRLVWLESVLGEFVPPINGRSPGAMIRRSQQPRRCGLSCTLARSLSVPDVQRTKMGLAEVDVMGVEDVAGGAGRVRAVGAALVPPGAVIPAVPVGDAVVEAAHHVAVLRAGRGGVAVGGLVGDDGAVGRGGRQFADW